MALSSQLSKSIGVQKLFFVDEILQNCRIVFIFKNVCPMLSGNCFSSFEMA
jgi:hypothetical protein